MRPAWLVLPLMLQACSLQLLKPPIDPFYDTVLNTDPSHAGALYLQGQHLIQAGQFREALPYFERLTKTEPEKAAGWTGLGHCRLETQDLTGAETAFTRGLGLEPSAEADLGLISSLILQGKTAEAKVRLQFVETKTGETAALLRLRGDLAFMEHRFEDSMAAYRASLAKSPDQPVLVSRIASLEQFLHVTK